MSIVFKIEPAWLKPVSKKYHFAFDVSGASSVSIGAEEKPVTAKEPDIVPIRGLEAERITTVVR